MRARLLLRVVTVLSLAASPALSPALPHAAADSPPLIPLVHDTVYDGVALEARTQDAYLGDGFRTFARTALLPDGYTVRLETSAGVEDFRAELAAAAEQVRTSVGLPVHVAAGQATPAAPGFAEIRVRVSATSPCDASGTAWAGCGGPNTGSGPKPGQTYVVSGDVWLHPVALQYQSPDQRHLVSHELGHALGLDHYDHPHEGQIQAMHTSSYDAKTFRSGDLNGLRWQLTLGALNTNDTLWFGNQTRQSFDSIPMSISGDYQPVAGDFNGDGYGDVFLYEPGDGPYGDHFMWGTAQRNRFTGQPDGTYRVSGWYEPVVGDFDGNGSDDIFLYDPGPGGWGDHVMWGGPSKTFSSTDVPVDGVYEPVVGDFDGDGASDIFLHEPGTGPYGDHIMWGLRFLRTFQSTDFPVSGQYTAFAGDFDGDGASDIFLYEPGNGPWGDHIRWGGPLRTGTDRPTSISGVYQPFTGDFDGDGRDDIFWYEPGSGSWGDHQNWGRADRGFDESHIAVGGPYTPLVEDFDGDRRSDILWYKAGDF